MRRCKVVVQSHSVNEMENMLKAAKQEDSDWEASPLISVKSDLFEIHFFPKIEALT